MKQVFSLEAYMEEGVFGKKRIKLFICILLLEDRKDSRSLCGGAAFLITRKGLIIFGVQRQKQKRKLAGRILMYGTQLDTKKTVENRS
jgi:hypothetical protein